ncbi:hypothetical protein BSKO_00960 [Bryopsis sp. KO-2023]|nr:hypothetical protein BSKO_00960 [Bryopsis sp. KO-2023]
MQENISVSVRVRPLGEKEDGQDFAWDADDNTMWQQGRPDVRYQVDNVFSPIDTTRHIFETTLRPLTQKVVGGFNATVFAYGQTSSGKTYTMQGTSEEPGVIPLTVEDVFAVIANSPSREFLCRVSYMELYNEEVNDLLRPDNMKLPIHEDKDSGVYVAGLTEEIVHDAEAVLKYLAIGDRNRHIASTKMNERSSRSHTVFRMIVESRHQDQSDESSEAGAVLVSTLTLVDLAGSERLAKTGAEGIRMKEGTSINKSLLTLGIVINQLANKGEAISYRDSKLTRILQPSLGGNARTAILCNITPAECHVEESSNTLRFACRAKKVVNSCTLNEVLSDAALMKRQAKEIEQLKKRLQDSGMTDVEEQIGKLRAELLRSEHDKELMLFKLEEEKAEKEKAQRQVQVAAQLMFEKDSAAAEHLLRMSKRRDTWCPGALAAPKKRPSESNTADSPGSEARSAIREGSLDEDMMLMPPPPTRRRTSGLDIGDMLSPTRSGQDISMEQDETAAMKELILVLEERVQYLSRDNEQKDAQIRSTQKDLSAVMAVKKRPSFRRSSSLPPPETEINRSSLRQSNILIHEGPTSEDRRNLKDMILEMEVQELQSTKTVLMREHAEGMLRMDKLENEVFDLTEVAQQATNRSELLTAEIEAAQQDIEKSREQVHSRDDEIEKLQTQLNHAFEELEGFRSKMEDDENDMGAANERHSEELAVYQQQISELQKERDELQSRMSSQHDMKEQRLKHKADVENMKRGGKERDLLTKEIDRFKKKADEAEGKVRSLVREKSDLQTERNGLQRQLKSTERTLERLTKENERKDSVFEKRKDTITGDLARYKEKLTEAEKKLKSMKADIEKKDLDAKGWQNENTNLQKQLQENQGETARLMEVNASMSLEVDQLRRDVLDFQERELQTSELLESLQARLLEAEAARDVNHQKMEGLFTQNGDLSERNSELAAKVESVTSELEQTRSSLDSTIHERMEIIEYMKRELQSERESLQLDLQAAGAELQKTQSDMISKAQEMDALKGELEGVRRLAEDQGKAMEQQWTTTQEKTKTLENALSGAKAEVQKEVDRCQAMQQKMKELEENMQGAAKQIGVLEDQKAQEIYKWQQNLQEQAEGFEGRIKSLISERDVVNQQLSHCSSLAEEQERSSKKKIKSMETDLQVLHEQVAKFEKENKALLTESENSKVRLREAQDRMTNTEQGAADNLFKLQDEKQVLENRVKELAASLETAHGEVVELKKELEASQESATQRLQQAEADFQQRMEHEKNDIWHEFEKQRQTMRELEAANAHLTQVKEKAKLKMMERNQDIANLQQEKEALRSKYDSKMKDLVNQLQKSANEVTSWKQLSKASANTEQWVKEMSNRIWEAEFRFKQLREDFDSDEIHLPTKVKVQRQVEDHQKSLVEKLRESKRSEHEYQGILSSLQKDIEKAGWEPKKLDSLLANTASKYKHSYHEGKIQRLERYIKEKDDKISMLSEEIRETRKQLPPTRIEVDISQPPPMRSGQH